MIAGVFCAFLALATGGVPTPAGGPAEPARGSQSGNRELLVFAASNLALVMPELAAAFERESGTRVTVVHGSSGNLARQIVQGAPADLFFAADEDYVDGLGARGLLRDGTRTSYAVGHVALAVRRSRNLDEGSVREPASLRELVDPDVQRIAMANPAYAPYGRAAEQALQRARILDAVRPKLVYADTVRQALQYLQTGAVDAALLPRSLPAAGVQLRPVDPALYDPIVQAAAVLDRTARPEEARAFLAFTTGPEGRRILARFGFDTAPPR